MSKPRGKRQGLRARSKNARSKVTGSKSQIKRIAAQRQGAVVEELVALLFEARGKLVLCRKIMEANDPGNALMVFGPPVQSPAKAEGETPKAEAPVSDGPQP